MSLFKKANIFKFNKKNDNEVEGVSTSLPARAGPPFPRLDLFLVIAVFILIISPFVINLIIKINVERKTINLSVSANLEELFGAEITKDLIDEFNEENSGVSEPKVRVRLFNQDEKKPELQEPDIFIFDEYEPDILFELTDLKKLIPDEANIDRLQDMSDEDAHPSDAPLFGIPLVSFMDVLFYNINILKEAGFDRPPRTRGEYNTYSKTVADNANPWFGSGIYSDDLSSPELNKPMRQKLEDFANGKAAMIVASTRAIPFFRDKLGDDTFSITAIPLAIDGSAGRYNINLSGIYIGIGAECANPEAAWKFLVFLIDKSPLFCELLKAVPGIPSNVIPADYIIDDPIYSKAWDIFEYNRN